MLFVISCFIFGGLMQMFVAYLDAKQRANETELERHFRRFRESLDK